MTTLSHDSLCATTVLSHDGLCAMTAGKRPGSPAFRDAGGGAAGAGRWGRRAPADSADDDLRARDLVVEVDLDAHLLGDAQRLLDQRLDDLRLGDGLDDLALHEDLPLA